MLVKQLLHEAQVHGSNRLTERYYRYWAISFLFLLYGAAGIITSTIYRYLDNPTYIAIIESQRRVMQFPQVVVCPEVDFPEFKMDAFMDSVEIPPKMNSSHVRGTLRQLAAFYAPDVKYNLKDLQNLEIILDYNYLSVNEAGRRLTLSCEETLLRCRLLGINKNCSHLFSLEFTAYGFCCIFNGRSLKREMHEFGVHVMKPMPDITVMGANPWASLEFAVNVSEDQTNIDLSYKWMGLAGGQGYVEAGLNGTPITPGMEYWIGHVAQEFLITEDAKELSPQLRRCRLTTEKLKYFPKYSRNNCLVECEMEQHIKNCGCVEVTQPRPPRVPYCRAKSLLCVKHTSVTFESPLCDCPSTCDKSSYSFITESSPLVPHNNTLDRFYNGLDFDKTSVVRAFVLHHNMAKFARRPVYSAHDLFSQIGGVFNVFFGCSILTLLEILQLSWHVFRNYWIDRKLKKVKGLILPPLKNKKNKFDKKKNVKKIRDKGKTVTLRNW